MRSVGGQNLSVVWSLKFLFSLHIPSSWHLSWLAEFHRLHTKLRTCPQSQENSYMYLDIFICIPPASVASYLTNSYCLSNPQLQCLYSIPSNTDLGSTAPWGILRDKVGWKQNLPYKFYFFLGHSLMLFLKNYFIKKIFLVYLFILR